MKKLITLSVVASVLALTAISASAESVEDAVLYTATLEDTETPGVLSTDLAASELDIAAVPEITDANPVTAIDDCINTPVIAYEDIKTAPATGVETVASTFGAAVIAAGIMVIARKRKID